MATLIIRYLQKILAATGYSLAGLKTAWCDHWAFRAEIVIFIIAAPLALFIGKTGMQRALLLSSLILVLIVEVLNSAIEIAINRISPERHELSRQAKDLGSAAVLLAGVNAVVVWLLVIFG